MDQGFVINDGHTVQRIVVWEVTGLLATQHIRKYAEKVFVEFYLIVRISSRHSAVFIFHIDAAEGKQGR